MTKRTTKAKPAADGTEGDRAQYAELDRTFARLEGYLDGNLDAFEAMLGTALRTAHLLQRPAINALLDKVKGHRKPLRDKLRKRRQYWLKKYDPQSGTLAGVEEDARALIADALKGVMT